MREIRFSKTTEQEAKEISTWKYPAPFELYSMNGSTETIKEFLSRDYYTARTNHEIIGYICFGRGARVPGGYQIGIYDDPNIVDIGLGLRPDLTGKGLGLVFMNETLAFLKKSYVRPPTVVQLVVTTFNIRAIKVYEKARFVQLNTFFSLVNGEQMEFQVMRLQQ